MDKVTFKGYLTRGSAKYAENKHQELRLRNNSAKIFFIPLCIYAPHFIKDQTYLLATILYATCVETR